MTSKTITLAGSEVRADYSGGVNAWIRNDGTAAVYASTTPGVTAGADGVVSIPAGQAAAVYGACGTVYISGTGSVLLVSSDYVACPFKTSAQSGGSGADEVARAAIEAHAGNAEIHVTAAEKASWDSKAEVSDIPTKTSELTNDSGYITSPDGGNAATLDGKFASDFMATSATSGLLTSINDMIEPGTYGIQTGVTPDAPTGYGSWGICDVRRYGAICCQTTKYETGIIINRAETVGQTAWGAWERLVDSTMLAALEARIAALEGGT